MSRPDAPFAGMHDQQPVGGVALDSSKSDTVNLSETYRGFIVGVAGDVKVTGDDNVAVVLPAMAAGVMHGFLFYRLWATGTTATGVVGLR